MSRGLKERTPAQLAVLAQAREKAKIVIAERAKINATQKTVELPEVLPVSEPPPPEPLSEEVPPPLPDAAEPVPPEEDSDSESEPRLTRREVGEMSQRSSPKYHYINGMYIKIK